MKKGFRIVQVYGRTPGKAVRLAKKLRGEYAAKPADIRSGADLYILAVADDAIEKIAGQIDPGKGIVIHMSGTKECGILKKVSGKTGVVYPVQTFSSAKVSSFSGVPLCIESGDGKTAKALEEFGNRLSGKVLMVSGEQRRLIHLAAVFANNFPNFMKVISTRLLEEKGIPVSILDPLIRKTAASLTKGEPFRFQTGPAMRGDATVIGKHLDQLASHPGYREIYRIITENIIQYKKSR